MYHLHVILSHTGQTNWTVGKKSRNCSAKLTSITFCHLLHTLDIFFFLPSYKTIAFTFSEFDLCGRHSGEHRPFAGGCLCQIVVSALTGLFKTFCSVYRHHQIPHPPALLTTLACPSVSTINGTICIFHCHLLSLQYALLVCTETLKGHGGWGGGIWRVKIFYRKLLIKKKFFYKVLRDLAKLIAGYCETSTNCLHHEQRSSEWWRRIWNISCIWERSWIRPLCRFSEHSLHFAYIQPYLSICLENFSWFWMNSTRTARSKCALWRESPLSLKNLLRCLSFMSNSCLLSSKALMSFLPLSVVSTVCFRMIVATSLNHWWPGRTLLLMQTVLWDLKKCNLFFFLLTRPNPSSTCPLPSNFPKGAP